MKRHRLQKDRVCMEFLSDSGNVGHIKEKPGKQRNLLGKQKQDATGFEEPGYRSTSPRA